MNDRSNDLVLQGVSLEVSQAGRTTHILRDVDLDIPAGSTLGVVGESGSGKSMLAKTIMQLLPSSMSVSGSVSMGGEDVLAKSPKELRAMWGSSLALVSQDPMRSLNPVVRIGRQVTEAMRPKMGLSKKEAFERGVQLLREVGIPSPEQRMRAYPHELSGGMRQRVCIAMALACEPDILIADEPTTALDVTVQRQILDLLETQQQLRGMSLILISHDLGVVAGRTSQLAVMYAGRVVEAGATKDVFRDMRHRYTDALLRAVPRLDVPSNTELASIPAAPAKLQTRTGCSFAPRCVAATDACRAEVPPFSAGAGTGHRYACFHPMSVPAPPPEPGPDVTEFEPVRVGGNTDGR
ncbi:ABC transporter ATP-binding protein [Nocardioides humi]|uniref:ABC transporter ATP-binding protein n=1 Tax=Nocardioides humi TaxID=449461 RepID=A0ABN2ABM7_9ACTN|nr:ABC transporter ATP-binding protein [Nocardioides humi]